MCQYGCGFLFKVGFGRQGRGFESGPWFLKDVGLILQLCFLGVVGFSPHLFLFGGVGRGGGCGFESTSLFLGMGGVFFKFCFVWVVVVVLL